MLIKRRIAPDWAMLACLFFFAAGILGGVWHVQKTENNGYLQYFLSGYIEDHLKGAFAPVFSVSFLSVMLFHGLLLCLALSCIAAPIILLFPLLKGYSFGMICALLYLKWSSRGLLMELCLLWLPAMIQAIALLVLSREAINSSLLLCKGAIVHRGSYLRVSIPKTVERFVFCSTAGLFAAITEGLLSVAFGKYFA